MKDLIKQIQFVDTILLPIFGMKSVTDFETKLNLQRNKETENTINKLNNNLDKLKEVFKVKEFNLHKSGNKVTTWGQAIGILRKCLNLVGINYELVKEKGNNYVRLIKNNIILENYIKHKEMSEIREFELNEEKVTEDANVKNVNRFKPLSQEEALELSSPKKNGTITEEELKNSIKRIEVEECYVPLYNVIDSINSENIVLNNRHIEIMNHNTTYFEVQFLAKKKNDKILVDQELIDKTFYGQKFDYNIGTALFSPEVILQKNKSIYPENKVLPFETAYFSHRELKIYTQSDLSDIKDFVLIKIINHKPIFKKKIIMKLNDLYECIMNYDDSNAWVFHQGIISIKSTNKAIQKLLIEDFRFILEKSREIVKDGLRILRINSNQASDALSALVCGYPIATIQQKTQMKLDYFLLQENQFMIKYYFFRDGDTLANIRINFKNRILGSCSFKIIEKEARDVTKEEELEFEMKNNEIQIKNFTLDTPLNLIKNIHGVFLVMTFSLENDIDDILKDSYIEYEALYYDIYLRRKLCSK